MATYKEPAILSAIEVAARRLGYQLRPKQEEAIVSFVSGRDALPTGSGKSLVFCCGPSTLYSRLRFVDIASVRHSHHASAAIARARTTV